jgi:hypothetical protein
MHRNYTIVNSIRSKYMVCLKKFGEWYQKTNKTKDTNKLTLLAFKIIDILHNTLLATFIKLLETVSKGLFRNLLQNHCHTFLDCRHICKTCTFHDALQAWKQKEVHRTPLILCARRRQFAHSAIPHQYSLQFCVTSCEKLYSASAFRWLS